MVARISRIFLNIAFVLQGGYQSMYDASWEIGFFGQFTNRKIRFSARSKFQNLETPEQRLTCLLDFFPVDVQNLSAPSHCCPDNRPQVPFMSKNSTCPILFSNGRHRFFLWRLPAFKRLAKKIASPFALYRCRSVANTSP